MKKLSYIIVALGIFFSSCDSYFDVELYQNIPNESAYNTVSDIDNALNGAYYALGTYRFHGRDLVALGDLASDNGVSDPASGHFVSLATYTYSETDGDLAAIWQFGYQVIDRTTRIINGAKALLEKGNLSDANIASLNSSISQAYALRAYANFMLVNVFGLPYGTDNDPHGGIVLIENEPIEPQVQVSRSSVTETYALILRDIERANQTPNNNDGEFYFNPAAIKALEARVNLYMKNYTVALAAAQAALDIHGTPADDSKYVSMWSSIAISPEDIFTVAKTTDDNLSANSLNTLYSTYGCAMTDELVALFAPTDIRKQLLDGNHPKKYDGIAGAAAVSNIPVFRVSEMYLIIAEINAINNQIDAAKDALFYTAKRNLALSKDQLPSTKEDLLKFISEERRREFFAEGHRWYDARRTGEIISVSNGYYTNYDISKLVYPIPSGEINAGYGTEQNSGWKDCMPQ